MMMSAFCQKAGIHSDTGRYPDRPEYEAPGDWRGALLCRCPSRTLPVGEAFPHKLGQIPPDDVLLGRLFGAHLTILLAQSPSA